MTRKKKNTFEVKYNPTKVDGPKIYSNTFTFEHWAKEFVAKIIEDGGNAILYKNGNPQSSL